MKIDLTPEAALAIEVGVKEALKKVFDGDARDKVAPDQTIEGMVLNLTLEVGALTIGHDTDKAPTASIPLLPTLALMVRRMGVQRDAALALLKETMTEALTLDKDAMKRLLDDQGVAEAEQMVKNEVIATLPRTPVKKAVKAKDVALTLTGIAQRPNAA